MVLCQLNAHSVLSKTVRTGVRRHISNPPNRHIALVKALPTWDLKTFQEHAFHPQIPVKLPLSKTSLPPACKRWFTHGDSSSQDVSDEIDIDLNNPPTKSNLRNQFWSEHASTMVPLELTIPSSNESKADNQKTPKFHRATVPLALLLEYLNQPSHPLNPSASTPSIYLAQCDLSTLPKSLTNDLPTPPLVRHAGKGDIYGTSLWLGQPPTYTPLHRDPNPNLLQQLAGQKIVRLFPPDVGDAVFEHVQDRIDGGGGGSKAFRGEEMMAGPEREILHEVVWGNADAEVEGGVFKYACQAELGFGEALFIPKGWWHSVKSVGSGVSASVNWWFR